jgi:uncharacterized protein YdhG (YjbR/CyaY superfamily)
MRPALNLTVDDYIAAFPESTQAQLIQMRETIREAAPEAEEVISYGMPAYKMKRVLVYFAGCAKHIGFYPTSSGIASFKQELSAYKGAKGSVQFPLNEPLPLDLIKRIVRSRLAEDLEKAAIKKVART